MTHTNRVIHCSLFQFVHLEDTSIVNSVVMASVSVPYLIAFNSSTYTYHTAATAPADFDVASLNQFLSDIVQGKAEVSLSLLVHVVFDFGLLILERDTRSADIHARRFTLTVNVTFIVSGNAWCSSANILLSLDECSRF